jgi:[ribosomal protein S5]-alanine N-acetyltransferase
LQGRERWVNRTQLRVATPEDLRAYLRGGPDSLASVLGVGIPAGWPEYPWIFEFTLETLQEHPGQAGWWMYYFLDLEAGVLIGSGGYKGPPKDGAVEVGYEIAPGFRGRGYATAVVRQLVDRGFSAADVAVIEARTLPVTNASAAVLAKVGFICEGVVPDDQTGQAWLWRKTRADRG